MDDNKLREIDEKVVDEMESDIGCLAMFRPEHRVEYARRLLAAADAEAVPEQPVTPSAESISDIVREHLNSVYICTRVWEAWHVGTMTQDDFDPADESMLADEIAADIELAYASPQPADVGVLVKALERIAKSKWVDEQNWRIVARDALDAWRAKR